MSKKWILSFLFVSALLVFLIHLLLQSGLISDKAKGVAERNLERLLGRPIRIEQVQLRSLSASILFKGITTAPAGPASPFSAEEIRVYFSPWSLITQSFFIRQIVIESPTVVLTPEFLAGTPFSMKGRSKQGPPPVVIRVIRVNNGSFSYQGAGAVRAVSVGGVHAEIRPDLRMTQFEIDLSAGKGTFSTEQGERPIDRMEAKLLFLPGSIEIKQALLDSGRASLRIDGTIHPKDDNRLDFRIDAHFPLEESGLAPIAERNLAGEALFQGQIKGIYPNLTAAGKIAFPHLFSAGTEVGSLLSEIAYGDRKVTLSSLSGSLFSGSFSGSAEADLTDEIPHYRASLQFHRLPLEKGRRLLLNTESVYDRALEGTFVEGTLSASGQGTAPEAWTGEGQITVKRLPLFSPPSPADAESALKLITLLQEANLQGKWAEGRLTVNQGKLALPRVEATFQGGWARQEGLSIETTLSAEEIKGVAEPLGIPVTGALHLDGIVSGAADQPHVEGKIVLDHWSLQKKAMGILASQFAYEAQTVLLKEGTLQSPVAAGNKTPPFRFDGSLRWSDSQPLAFDIKTKVASADPQVVFHFFNLSVPLQTTATGLLSISGSPQAFTVKGPLTVTRGVLYDEPFDRGKLELTVTEKGVSLQKVVLEREKGRVEGEGEIGYRGTYRIAAKGTALPIQEIHLLRSRAPLLFGEATLEVAGEGSFHKPKLRGTATFQGLRYGEMEGKSGTLKVDWSEELIRWEGTITKNLTAHGEIRLVESYPFSFRGQFGRLRVDSFLKERLSPPFSKMTLSMTGELQGNGILSRIDQMNLTGKLTELNADLGGYPVDNDGPIAIRAAQGIFTFENARLKGDNTALEFNGGMTPFKQWDLFVKGEANLNLFPFFSKTITSGRGMATLDVRIADQWEAPTIRGELSLQNGTIRTVSFAQSVHISSLSVVFSERALLLETLEGEMGRGRFHATGKADLVGFGIGRFGFLLEIIDTRVSFFQDLPATVNGELFYQREGTDQTLKGELTIKKVIYDKRIDLKSLVTELRKRKDEEIATETPLIGATKMNIHLYGKENIAIDNNWAKAPVEVDLFLKGTIDHPLLIGRVDIPRGTIFYRKNEFKIESASLEFLNSEKIDPTIQLKAKTTVNQRVDLKDPGKKYAVDLSLTGTLSQFTLSLASDPPLADTDILALLTFGKTTAELAQTQRGAPTNEAAGLALSGVLEGPVQKLTDPVQRFTGIDRIQIDPYQSGSKSSIGPRLTAEKRLMDDRVIVTYTTTLDPSEEDLFRMIYELTKNVSLVGERDEFGQLRGTVQFRFEFR